MAAHSQYPVTYAPITVQPAMYQHPAGFKDQVWSTNLCGCCEDMSICCLGLWCPVVLACLTHSDFGECLCMPLVDMLCGGLPATSLAMRTALRERYHIQGDMCNDCCIVTCCGGFSMCQMAREMKNRRQTVLTTTHTTTVYNALPPQ